MCESLTYIGAHFYFFHDSSRFLRSAIRVVAHVRENLACIRFHCYFVLGQCIVQGFLG